MCVQSYNVSVPRRKRSPRQRLACKVLETRITLLLDEGALRRYCLWAAGWRWGGGKRMNAGSKTNFPLSATRMIMWMAFGTFWIRFRVWDCERLRGVKENTYREWRWKSERLNEEVRKQRDPTFRHCVGAKCGGVEFATTRAHARMRRGI